MTYPPSAPAALTVESARAQARPDGVQEPGHALGQVPMMSGITATPAEAEFGHQLLSAGYSGSYTALLGLAATLTFDAGEYFHTGQEERRDEGEWHGYHRGVQTALACLVMHETGCNPGKAALLVAEHIETLIRCRWTSRPANGGE